MAATFKFSVTHGSAPGTTVDASYIHLVSSDVAANTLSNAHASYPITIPTSGPAYSYQRWVRGHWTGTFTSISSVLFWKSAGIVGASCTILAGDKGNQTYVTPTVTASASLTGTAIPTTSGAALSLGYSSNYSDYAVLQLRVMPGASTGANGPITYKFQWSET